MIKKLVALHLSIFCVLTVCSQFDNILKFSTSSAHYVGEKLYDTYIVEENNEEGSFEPFIRPDNMDYMVSDIDFSKEVTYEEKDFVFNSTDDRNTFKNNIDFNEEKTFEERKEELRLALEREQRLYEMEKERIEQEKQVYYDIIQKQLDKEQAKIEVFKMRNSYDADGFNRIGLDRNENDLIKFDFEVNSAKEVEEIGIHNINLMRDSFDFINSNLTGFNLLEKNCVFYDKEETDFSKCFAKLNVDHKRYYAVVRCNIERECILDDLIFQDYIDGLTLEERNVSAKINLLNEIQDTFSDYKVIGISSCENNKFTNSQRLCKAKIELDDVFKHITAWCSTEKAGCQDVTIKESSNDKNVTYSCFEGYTFNNTQCIRIKEGSEI